MNSTSTRLDDEGGRCVKTLLYCRYSEGVGEATQTTPQIWRKAYLKRWIVSVLHLHVATKNLQDEDFCVTVKHWATSPVIQSRLKIGKSWNICATRNVNPQSWIQPNGLLKTSIFKDLSESGGDFLPFRRELHPIPDAAMFF